MADGIGVDASAVRPAHGLKRRLRHDGRHRPDHQDIDITLRLVLPASYRSINRHGALEPVGHFTDRIDEVPSAREEPREFRIERVILPGAISRIGNGGNLFANPRLDELLQHAMGVARVHVCRGSNAPQVQLPARLLKQRAKEPIAQLTAKELS